MTIESAIKCGIDKVRKPFWNKAAYLKLHLTQDGHAGPWVELHDPFVQREREPDQILLMQADDKKDDWEPV